MSSCFPNRSSPINNRISILKIDSGTSMSEVFSKGSRVKTLPQLLSFVFPKANNEDSPLSSGFMSYISQQASNLLMPIFETAPESVQNPRKVPFFCLPDFWIWANFSISFVGIKGFDFRWIFESYRNFLYIDVNRISSGPETNMKYRSSVGVSSVPIDTEWIRLTS